MVGCVAVAGYKLKFAMYAYWAGVEVFPFRGPIEDTLDDADLERVVDDVGEDVGLVSRRADQIGASFAAG